MENKKGKLEVICGSMFSGKTEELMRRLKRAEYAKQNVLTIKHKIDTRRSFTEITSHDGKKRTAFSLENNLDSLLKIYELANKNIQIIGIDEIHFFPMELVDILLDLVDQGKRIIVAGLDLDFRGKPFEITSKLMSYADHILKLKAICVICGQDAHHTQRIIDGKPAKYDDPIILVGASECYEARCKNCFQIERKPFKSYLDLKKEKETAIQL